MNAKEIGEIRRQQKRERSNMGSIYGCYVGDNKEIISTFTRHFSEMPQNEAERYFTILRRVLGGANSDKPGKNLLDISFTTAQVADAAPEHKLLMDLRSTGIEDEELRKTFFQKVVDNLEMECAYLIILGADTYDVPFKNKNGDEDADASDQSFSYCLCAICPVKLTKPVLHYVHDSRDFQDGNIVNAVSFPEVGFLFPAFTDRATDIYSALYYNRNAKDNHEKFVSAIFNVPIAQPAAAQKASFAEMVAEALGEECNLDTLSAVQDNIRSQMLLHKENHIPEPLTLSKNGLSKVLEDAGVSDDGLEAFGKKYEEVFGQDTEMYPENIFKPKKIEITTANAVIRVAGDRSDLVETRVIGGVKYILVKAEEGACVNGVQIHIGE